MTICADRVRCPGDRSSLADRSQLESSVVSATNLYIRPALYPSWRTLVASEITDDR